MNPVGCPACGGELQLQPGVQAISCTQCGRVYVAPPVAPPPVPQSAPSGMSTMAVVGIVVGVGFLGFLLLCALIAAIAIPNLVRARLSANESAAIRSMRTIASVQMVFQAANELDSDGDGFGEYGTLADLGGGPQPHIDSVLATGTRQGYRFECTPGVDPEKSYTCTATPIEPGRTGNRSFYVDETGVIRFSAVGPVNADAPPL